MSSTNVTTPHVWPSQNDLNGGVSNDGKRMLEKYAREFWSYLNGISYVASGGALPASAANLVLIVPAGVAVISGLLVKWAATNVTLPASSTSHIFVKLNFSGGIVAAGTGVQIEDNTSGTHPADAIKLGTAVTNGSVITSTTDQRLLDGNQRIRRARISATGTTSWIVPANVTRARLRQWGAGGGAGGGGGGGSGGSGGGGAPGNRGAYWEAVVAVTPGATLTVINGTGGSGGGGGAGTPFNPGTGDNGSNGTAGGSSSVSGSGFSFTAGGGSGGGGGSAGTDVSNGGSAVFAWGFGLASVGSGTADVLSHGNGNAPGISPGSGGGSFSAGSAGGAGQSAVTIIDY